MIHFAIISRSYPFLISAIIINGFFTLSVFSVAYEMGVELTFPIGEATSGGFINTLSNLIGFVLVMSLTPILDNKEKKDVLICSIVFTSTLLLALIILSLTKLKLKREAYEKSRKNIQKDTSITIE